MIDPNALKDSRSYTIQDWLLYFSIANSFQEANELCEVGKIRLNGQVQSNSLLVPQPQDVLSSTDNDYNYMIPSFETLYKDLICYDS